MSEQELRRHRCCFTGHRPEHLGMPEPEVISSLKEEIRHAVADGFQTFISGVSRGVDLWAAEIVLALRDEGAAVRLICASPYQGFESRWSREWQERYRQVMKQADLVRFICPGYSRDCFQWRNEWMVDHSARVIAVYNGQPSGTRNTIEYYGVFRVTDANGDSKQKWVSTKIQAKRGNKREAQKAAEEIASKYEEARVVIYPKTPFWRWLETWLEQKQNEVDLGSVHIR